MTSEVFTVTFPDTFEITEVTIDKTTRPTRLPPEKGGRKQSYEFVLGNNPLAEIDLSLYNLEIGDKDNKSRPFQGQWFRLKEDGKVTSKGLAVITFLNRWKGARGKGGGKLVPDKRLEKFLNDYSARINASNQDVGEEE